MGSQSSPCPAPSNQRRGFPAPMNATEPFNGFLSQLRETRRSFRGTDSLRRGGNQGQGREQVTDSDSERKHEHGQAYYFLMLWPFVIVVAIGLEVLDLTQAYYNPTSSPVIWLLSFFAVLALSWWAYDVKVGRHYQAWLKAHARRRASDEA